VDAHALAGDGQTGLLVRTSLPIEDLRDDEVLVRVTHCGVCRSDLTRLRSPRVSRHTLVVPGHEIVGEVVRAGRDVRRLSVGARVGIGWQSGSCGRCEWCLRHEEHLCATQEETCVGRFGGFASHIKVQERFALPLPAGLDSAHAAPLLCAGITVYSPMVRRSLGHGHRAAVVGIGGLGHLALQFLRAMGCSVDAFSTSVSKAEDALGFGAEAFYCLNDRNTMSNIDSTYDFVLSTSPGVADVTGLIRMLRPRGVLCLVGLPQGDTTFDADELIAFQKTIEGSPIGSTETMSDMFQFALDKGVKPTIECFPMSEANRAMGRLSEHRVRYRAVLTQDLDV
jgi:uncharacterized zinc-type alcohol dehydrogenase-like protein